MAEKEYEQFGDLSVDLMLGFNFEEALMLQRNPGPKHRTLDSNQLEK